MMKKWGGYFFAGAMTLTMTQGFAQYNMYGVYNLHRGPYVSANVGTALGAYKNEQGQIDGGVAGIGGSTALGYMFNPYFGIEVGGTGMEELIATAVIYDLAAKINLPVGERTSLYAKVGGAGLYTSACDDSFFASTTCASSTTGGVFVGAGIGVALTQRFDLALEYNGIVTSSSATSDGLIGVLGLGFIYHFS